MRDDLAMGVEQKLGHAFQDPLLLRRALTHRSASQLTDASVGQNERLELLGDAVLGLLVADRLLRSCPAWDEGRISTVRSQLVRESALAAYARDLDLGAALLLGKGEEESGGRHKQSILAGAYEALWGALFLDAGYDEAHRLFSQMLGPVVDRAILSPTEEDAKTTLQREIQRRFAQHPLYETEEVGSPQDTARFRSKVLVKGEILGEGEGASKKQAEQAAAQAALAALMP